MENAPNPTWHENAAQEYKKKNFEKNEVNTPIQDSDEKFSHLNEMFCKLRKILKIIKQKAWKLKSP